MIDSAADVPRQAPAREPRQARRAAHDERQAGAGRAGPGPGRLRVHAARTPRAAARRAALLRTVIGLSARAGIVVTGTEVLTGRVQDRNGPWLSDRLLELGVELAHITICGDRPEDIEAQLRFMADQGVDLIITSGGLGPTADDMTVEMVARFAGRALVLDEELEERIAEILKPLMARFSHWDFDAVRAANRKQALVPEGVVRDRPGRHGAGRGGAGQADGRGAARAAARAAADVAHGGGHARPSGRRSPGARATARRRCACSASRSRGSPRRCARPRRGSTASTRSRSRPACAAARSRWSRATSPRRRGVYEELRRAAARAPRARDLLRGRLARGRPGGAAARRAADRHGGVLHGGADGGAADRAARARPRTWPAAWWRTRTRRRSELLGVDPRLIERHGAVSEPVAEAMAEGALRRFEADTAVAITGIAGPGRRHRGEAGGHRLLERAGSPTGARSRGRCGCRATARTSATARRRWRCTCCGACCGRGPS